MSDNKVETAGKVFGFILTLVALFFIFLGVQWLGEFLYANFHNKPSPVFFKMSNIIISLIGSAIFSKKLYKAAMGSK